MSIPLYVGGKLGSGGNPEIQDNEPYNFYFSTKKGLLIPDLVPFFGDTCGRYIQYIGAEVNQYQKRAKMSSEETVEAELAEHIDYAKKCIDEVLAIAEPENSYGFVKTEFKGMYPPDSIYFFNTEKLRALYALVSKPLLTKTKKPTKNFHNIMSYWDRFHGQYADFYDRLRAAVKYESLEDLVPTPPGVLALGIKMRE